jgi:glycosyltransferase involved in cell wall biosynthesis
MSSPSARRALFVQPFGIAGSGGGGPRILTSMVRGQPFEALSINCHQGRTRPVDWIEQRHVPLRPSLGRIDRTRFAGIGYWTEIVSRASFERRLAAEMDAWAPQVVHVLPHWTCDFHAAWRHARSRGWRVVMSIHDDLAYALPGHHPLRKQALRMLARMWPDVDHVFAISQELGDEYNARYGKRCFDIITDGVEKIADRPAPIVPGRLRVYFMGLFHFTYRENLQALTQALAAIRREQPALDLQLVMRCGGFQPGIDAAFPAEVLPFASQATVLQDMETADLLYMPLPFGGKHEGFTRFSLSTKMVSYLASGAPILFHGPRDSAAAHLLGRHRAAVVCSSLDPAEIAAALKAALAPETRQEIVENALRFARTAFPMEELRRKFLLGLFPGAID